MKMCNEMYRLRTKLSERGISWDDKSSVYTASPIDVTIYRTHFTVEGYFFSVIYGYGTYGGVDVFGNDKGLLECMTEKVNGGEPLGSLTADDVMRIIDGQEG